jgi:hypothetical protein
LTDGTQSAAKVVEEVAQSVKSVFEGAFTWAETKVDNLSSESDCTGPYTSQATCVISDLDPIASGVLAAMAMMKETYDPAQEQKAKDERRNMEVENTEGEHENNTGGSSEQ